MSKFIKPKHIKKAVKVFSLFFTLSVLIIIFTPLANLMARPLVIEPSLVRADMIVVLGGGLYENGVLGPDSTERLIRGLTLLRDGYSDRILFAGGSILKPVRKIIHTLSEGALDTEVDAAESAVMREIALKLGFTEAEIHVDEESTNTYENIRFVKEFMEKEGLKNCLLVTSPTHMRRAYGVARKLGIEAYPAPVGDYTPYQTSGLSRLGLFKAALHEYGGLAVYRLYGYI